MSYDITMLWQNLNINHYFVVTVNIIIKENVSKILIEKIALSQSVNQSLDD